MFVLCPTLFFVYLISDMDLSSLISSLITTSFGYYDWMVPLLNYIYGDSFYRSSSFEFLTLLFSDTVIFDTVLSSIVFFLQWLLLDTLISFLFDFFCLINDIDFLSLVPCLPFPLIEFLCL